ncbi:N-alpha-acetyltransferase 25, NatB auxiliary subunit [Ixodes scapularis]|uniref:N-alpha-acetyltransferase 25, NatB auxiliary subunit n=1 Tax=Ixodes scapularis TaxID=6945 RepID=UPI001C38AFF7|nr:N-alpha-acetyltransferase 25, NatB auxiliary subunit [Ixodes scapularis]
MASMVVARSHADSSINERRLRPVYDYLDNGNHKKALQEAEKLLKKQKDFSCAKALKALALVRLTRMDEAYATLKELQQEAVTDDPTLQAMTLCYRELERPELIVEAYERASQKEPQNEELLTHLFMGYVRLGQAKQQRHAALALHRLRHKNPYYFWAVMSLVVEAGQPDTSAVERSTLLLLAQRMVDKFVKEGRLEAEAEVQLYLMVLEMQEKYQEALDVLEGPLGEILTSYLDFVPQHKVELLSKLQRWPQVNSICKSLLLDNPDHWLFYQLYLDSVEKLQASGWTPETQSEKEAELRPRPDHTFELALDFVESLTGAWTSRPGSSVLRGPFMARISVLAREGAGTSRDLLVNLLMEFFERTGHKASCVLDISHLLSSFTFPEEDVVRLLDKMEDSLKVALPDTWHVPPDVNTMQRHLTWCQLRYYLTRRDAPLSKEQRLQLVRDLFESYQNGLRFGIGLLPTDFQPSDNYAILAGCILLDVWQESGDNRVLLWLLAALERALLNSPSCFQLKLLLLKVYGRIGAATACQRLAELLDIKHIQHDTLGYLVTPVFLKAGHLQAAGTNMNSALKLFTGNYKDTTDYLISCYKYGSFTKIQEIVRFRERLNNSLQFATLTAEKMILELLLEVKSQESLKQVMSCLEIDPVHDKTAWHELRDNRDVQIFREWGASRKKLLADALERSRQEEVMWLRIRNLLLRLLAAGHALTQGGPQRPGGRHADHGDDGSCQANGERPQAGLSVLSDLLGSLGELARELDASTLASPASCFPVQCPGPSRLPLFVGGGCLRTLQGLFHWLEQLYRHCEDLPVESVPSEDSKVRDNLVPLVKSLVSDVRAREVKSLLDAQMYLEQLVNLAEVVGWCSLVLTVGSTIVRPTRNAVTRKGKKKKEAATDEVALKQFSVLLAEVEAVAADARSLVGDARVVLLAPLMATLSVEEEEPILPSTGDAAKDVHQRIEQSYEESLKELGALLDTKMKLLRSLH